jgi:hypothetical protein
MTANTNSVIAALCYAQRTNLDFRALTVEMAQALRKTGEGNMEFQNNYDDVVIFDLPDGRIALAHSDLHLNFPDVWVNDGFAECLFIAVSSTSDISKRPMVFASLAMLLDGIVELIEGQLPSDRTFRFERDEVFTEAMYDQLVEQIWATTQASGTPPQDGAFDAAPEITESAKFILPAMNAAKPGAAGTHARGHSVFGQRTPGDDVPEIAAHVDAERHLRDQAFPAKAKTEHKTDVRRPTHPAAAADAHGAKALAKARNNPRDEIDCIRMALYPPDDETENGLFENTRAQTTLHRVAVHALNTSVMAFSLPVGAAMLTLSLAGRESMALSLRLTATTGSAIGVMQTDYWHAVLSFLT